MQYYRCKCGESSYYDSGMPPKDCQGCDKCGTTYAQHPDDHKERIEHDWVPQYHPDTGKPDGKRCKRCYARSKDNL